MKIYSRSRWNARSSEGGARQAVSSIREFFVHHSASPGKGIDNFVEQCQTMRDMQAFHMGPERGWADIAYHYVVFQPYGRLRRARIFEGRGLATVPAAQLNHNTNTQAVCVVSRTGEPIKRSTKRALKWLYKRSPASSALGHFQVTLTECPGPELKAFLPELRKVKHG